jgi:hypothetical protein
MIERIRADWRQFEASRSGFRFRERYRRRKRSSRAGFDFRKALRIVVGITMTIGSLLLAPLPGPGWGTFLVGLMILSGELYIIARLLDQAEVMLRRPARRAKGLWARSPTTVRILVGVVVPICSVVLGLWALLSVLWWLL